MRVISKLLFIVLFSSQASAGDVSSAQIETLMLDRNHGEKVFIKLNKKHTYPINCHKNSWEYILDISDDLGKSIYSSLLASYAAGTTVNFIGSSSCSLYPNIESLRRIELEK